MLDSVLDGLKDTPVAVWDTLAAMAPYLLFGFLVAGVLHVLISAETVERELGGSGMFLGPLKAALFGVPLPLCSCGVIPVAASLHRHGAGKGATTSFLISTPQTGVDSILVTYSVLGPVFAVVRPVAALVSGLVGGVIAGFAEPRDTATGTAAPACEDDCCAVAPRHGRLVRALGYGYVTLPRDLWKALVVGLVVAGALSAVVPKDYLASHLGGAGVARQLLAIVVMMAVGLPVYVCATASVPLAAAFIHMGVSPGAALAFLIAGPATNVATLATVWKTMGRRVTTVYLATVAVSAVAAGLALNHVIGLTEVGGDEMLHVHATHGILPEWAGPVSAVVLTGILAAAALSPLWVKKPAPVVTGEGLDGRSGMTTLRIRGMTCSHCVNAVTRALKEARGVEGVEVSLQDGKAVVTGEGLDTDELTRKVEELGYRAAPGSTESGTRRGRVAPGSTESGTQRGRVAPGSTESGTRRGEVTGVDQGPGAGKESADGDQGHAD